MLLYRYSLSLIALLLLLGMSLHSPQTTSFVVPLWKNGAPGFENRKDEPEQAKDYWVNNIHNPSLTIFPAPKEKATGAAVVICPGGGHRELVFNAEGREAAEYLNSIGVTACVLKYRLFREPNSPYTIENVRQDANRAMRVVRSHATEWNIDPNRLGLMGFSAGGEVVALITNGKPDKASDDLIDGLNAKPDFQILIYPGPLAVPDSITSVMPPAFLLAANDDVCCSGPVVEILRKYRKANIPIEVHLYAKGNHGFNMGNRSKLNSIKTWPQRLGDWLADSNILNPVKAPDKK